MTINEITQGSITILQLQGRLDATTAPQLDQASTAVVDKGARHVVLDLGGLEYVSSAGLRAILSSAKRLQKAEGKLVLASASSEAQQILNMAGFSAIVPLFDTVAEASSALAPAPAPEAAPENPLTFAEEIYLLALDDEKGFVKPMPTAALDYALAGAILMELALGDWIDNDIDTLKVTSTQSPPDPLLDEVFQELRKEPEQQTLSYWLKTLVVQAGHIEERVLARLIAKGILKQEDRRVLWVFEVRSYPLMDNHEVKEVRARLRELILSDEIPDPRDVVLISLASACELLSDLFTADEYKRVQPRIAALARLDLIGQALTKAVTEIERALDAVMTNHPIW